MFNRLERERKVKYFGHCPIFYFITSLDGHIPIFFKNVNLEVLIARCRILSNIKLLDDHITRWSHSSTKKIWMWPSRKTIFEKPTDLVGISLWLYFLHFLDGHIHIFSKIENRICISSNMLFVEYLVARWPLYSMVTFIDRKNRNVTIERCYKIENWTVP